MFPWRDCSMELKAIDRTKNAEASPAMLIGEPQAFRLATAFSAISDSRLPRDIVQLVERIAKQRAPDTQ
jgi:hypothetical protein